MNIQLLKVLVVFSDDKGYVNISAFRNRFPQNQTTLNNLETLHNLGYIFVTYGDDDIDEITVLSRGVTYCQ